MFDPSSRYAALPAAAHTMPDGRTVTYVTRRLLPDAASLPVLARAAPGPGERLDLFAARTLGNPLLFWRICDANDASDPATLLDGAPVLSIPMPVG